MTPTGHTPGARAPATPSPAALAAVETIHQRLFTGLTLRVARDHGQRAAGAFIEATFRHQHDERFVPGLATLGLSRLPPAVASAQFLYLANAVGGVEVEFMPESDRRAWIRYPPPRWAYEGPSICALGDEVTIGFMRGFHARCGESLGVPGLGFVCTGMTTRGDPGLEGYFEERDGELAPSERLRFELGRAGPRFDPALAPPLPFSGPRLAKARRNYAVNYIRVMLPVLADRLGWDEGVRVGREAARLVGLQSYRETAGALGIERGGRASFTRYLEALLAGTGDRVINADPDTGTIEVATLGISSDPRCVSMWGALWEGALAVHDRSLSLAFDEQAMRFTIGATR